MAPRKQMRKKTVRRRNRKDKAPIMLSKRMKSAIKKVVATTNETKYAAEDIMSDTTFNSVITGALGTEVYRCVPLISQGSASNQRVGKRIQPLRGNTIFEFRFATGAQTAYDITVCLFMYIVKADRDYGSAVINPPMVDPYNILDNGNGQNIPFNGIWQDANKRFNTEEHILLHFKKFRLAKPVGASDGIGFIGDNRGGTGLSSLMSPTKTYKLSFKPPKYLEYEDPVQNPGDLTLSTIPTSYAPVWACGYYYNDGTAPDTGDGVLKVAVRNEMYYKDA